MMSTSEPSDACDVHPAEVRSLLVGIETTFGAALVCPQVREAFDRLDLGFGGVVRINLLTRAAPMGAVNAEVVAGTFYNFNPALAAGIFPQVWQKVSPERVLALYQEAFSPALAAMLAPLGDAEIGELAGLARTAAIAASRNIEGRPLLAGLASLPWPAEDHLVIWHAAKILREHRGDGHLAALIVAGLRGIEALVVHAAFDGLPAGLLRKSRRWDEESWQAAMAGLRLRGWLNGDEEPSLTAEGRRRRQWIEDKTDELAAPPFQALGAEGMARMRELGDKVEAAIQQAGFNVSLRPGRQRLG